MDKFYNQFLFLFLSSSSIFSNEYPRYFEGYWSQKGQDKYLNELIFHGKREGIFVDIGAHDGISFSNSYYFEKELNWSGICVEPYPDQFENLQKNRSCICEPVAIAENNEKKLFLKCSGFITEMYSGLVDFYDQRHMDRIDQEIEIYGGSKQLIEVDCLTCNELLSRHSLYSIDLMCIDIEGGEEIIIKSIDFDLFKIKVIVIENNFNEERINTYLESKGYQFSTRLGKDDIYTHVSFNQ